MLKANESTVPSDQDGTLAGVGRLAARLAGSDLDAESLEMITAALTAEVCDDVNAADA